MAGCLFTKVYGQRIVSGKVVGEGGEALPGVNVLVKGTSTGTVTDINGNYQLSVTSDQPVLRFTFVGYSETEVNLESFAEWKTISVDVQIGENDSGVILYCCTDHEGIQGGPHGGPDKDKLREVYRCASFENCDF